MIRGDTHKFKWRIETTDKDTGEKTWWVPTAADKVYFTCKKDYSSPVAFQKVFPDTISFDEEDGYFRTTIEPVDTNKLDFGQYLYDIEIVVNALTNEKNIVKTVAIGNIVIEKEVTWRKDEV